METEWGQNWAAREVISRLSRNLQTKISIKHVKFTFFNRMELQGVYVEDQKKDTLMYAGAVEVRITDWFFFKDKADLKYIGLKDATIYFNRTDSVWNYRFLEDYFATPAQPKKKKSAGIQFNLKQVDLQNVVFKQNDAWLGNNILMRVGALDMDVHDLSISRKTVVVSNVDLKAPFFSTYDYPGKFKDTTASGPSDWRVSINRASIENGGFRIDNGSLTPAVSYFDGSHIFFNNINGSIRNFQWQDETITANLNIAAKERSGLHVKSLKTDFTFSPTTIELDKLFLQTNRSTIGNYLSLHFKDLNSFKNFNHEVEMHAHFNKAAISSEDLAFFIPAAGTWNRNVKISGDVEGTVADLQGRNMDVWAGNSTHFDGNISIAGLPDINRTYTNLEANDFRTTYADAVSFVPALKKITTPNLRKLSYVQFAGTFSGYFNDFTTKGFIKTKLGNIRTDIAMKLPARGEPTYAGTLSTGGFQLGEFINSRQLGVVDFHGSLKGRGFNWETMNLDVNGVIHRIRYEKYTYQNITAKGNFNRQKFNGDFVIKDPNADLHLNGLIDFSGTRPLINAVAQVRYANLKKLQLTQDDLVVKGDFRVNLQGSNLSNLAGTARVSNASIVHNGNRLSFDSLYVNSGYVNGIKTLKAVSNEFDVTITGDFDLGNLPDAFRAFLHRYYPSYVRLPRTTKPQNFTFDIKTGVVEDYLKLIDPRLSGFNNSELKGSLNIAANSMTIDANVPYFAFQQHEFTDVVLKGSGDMQKLSITGQVGRAVVDSSMVFPQTAFTITAANDNSDINIQTTSNLAINQANLSARITTFSDGITVFVHPSSFVIRGKTWTIEEGGELSFRKSSIVHGELVLREAQQEIIVRSVPSSVGSWNDMHVSIRNLNLNDVSPFIFKKNNLEGTLSGEVVVEDPANKFLVTANLRTEHLQLDNDSLGRVDVVASYDNRTGLLVGRGNNADPQHYIDFDLSYNLKNSTGSNNRISLHPRNFQLKFLERFLGSIFTDIAGTVTGDIDILLNKNQMDFLAKVRMKDAGFKVVFTQVRYSIVDTDLELTKEYLNLNGILLKDAEGNTAKVSGGIRHKGFSDMYFDVAVQTLSPRMELINTTYKDNQTFYGKAKGSGSFVMVGPQYDMNMFIDAVASSTDSSWVTLPPARSRESGQANFMVEKKYGTEMTPTELRGAATNITYQVNLTATPMVEVKVILDELTGDIIRGRGRGNLEITSGTSAPLTINGRYDIEEGDYLFTFQSVFKRPFVLRKGANNYIEWTRDPYDAKVNLEAVYHAENVSFAPLATTLLVDQAQTRSLAQLRDDVNVVAKLTGALFQPKFDFRLEFPSNSNVFNNPAIAFGIQQLQNNPNELYKQVTYLIVTNSFAPYETNAVAGAGVRPLEEFTFSTVSGLFFNVLNRELNQIFNRIFRNNRTFTFNFTGSLYNRNLIDPNSRGIRLFNQVASNVSIGTSLLNGKAIFTVGGTFDVPLNSDVTQNIQLLPDVSLEVLLNKSGSLRATFFYRQNVDFIYGSSTAGSPTTKRFGAGISYNKEFDSITEILFGKKQKAAKKDTTTTTAVVEGMQ